MATVKQPSNSPIDLRTINAGEQEPQSQSDVGSPSEVNPVGLEDTRRWIAFFLLGILTLVILIEVLGAVILAVNCWVYAARDGSCPAAQTSMGLLTNSLGAVFTAMVGLVGSVVGFYFGSKTTGK